MSTWQPAPNPAQALLAAVEAVERLSARLAEKQVARAEKLLRMRAGDAAVEPAMAQLEALRGALHQASLPKARPSAPPPTRGQDVALVSPAVPRSEPRQRFVKGV